MDMSTCMRVCANVVMCVYVYAYKYMYTCINILGTGSIPQEYELGVPGQDSSEFLRTRNVKIGIIGNNTDFPRTRNVIIGILLIFPGPDMSGQEYC